GGLSVLGISAPDRI
ncbi:hypothetical protein ACFTZM_01665, partial [Streptomyces hydrogenans]